MDDPKPSGPEYREGEEAVRAFTALVKKAVSTPPAKIQERHEKWQQERKRAKGKNNV